MITTGILIIASGACTVIARQMAMGRGWSPGLWGLMAAFLGPVPIAVMLLTPKNLDQDA